MITIIGILIALLVAGGAGGPRGGPAGCSARTTSSNSPWAASPRADHTASCPPAAGAGLDRRSRPAASTGSSRAAGMFNILPYIEQQALHDLERAATATGAPADGRHAADRFQLPDPPQRHRVPVLTARALATSAPIRRRSSGGATTPPAPATAMTIAVSAPFPYSAVGVFATQDQWRTDLYGLRSGPNGRQRRDLPP